MGASADPFYTIRAIRAIIQATVSPLFDVLDTLDLMDGDPDVEPNSDELDQSYPEAVGPRDHVITGRASEHEDDEPDNEHSGGDEANPDFARIASQSGAGCAIADPGGCEHHGREWEEGL